MKQYMLGSNQTRIVVWLDKDVNVGDAIKVKDQKCIYKVLEKYRYDDQPAWWYQVTNIER